MSTHRERNRAHLEAMARDTSSPREAITALRLLGRVAEALWREFQLWHEGHVETTCPGCHHGEYQHVAAQCYICGYCGWSILGDGNAYDLPAGWHHWT